MVLTVSTPINRCLCWILWKVLGPDYELVQVVLQVVSTSIASMSIIDSEEGALRPCLDVLLALGSDDVEDDADSILVVISDDPLVGIG